LSAPVGPESGRAVASTVLPIWCGKRERITTTGFTSQLALCSFGEAQSGEAARGCLAHRAQPLSSSILCCRCGYRRRGSARAQSTKRAVRQLSEQQPGHCHSQGGDRVRIMPLGADAASRATGRAPAGLIIEHGRRGRRGKNGSAHSPETHKLQCTRRRDGESRASRVLLLRPFDQEPFLRIRLGPVIIAVGRAHADRGETRAQGFLTAGRQPISFHAEAGEEKANCLAERAGNRHYGAGVWELLRDPGKMDDDLVHN
jgi:hypothetical protein